MDIKDKIKKKAREIGFDLIGFTDVTFFNDEYNKLLTYREQSALPGFMPSYDLELLTHPDKVYSSAETIISLGLSYALPEEEKEEVSISDYARGIDYHLVMKKKLSQLSSYLENFDAGYNTKFFVDTGPLLERKIAVRAGLGWIGKNHCLINPVYGSRIFLGEIFIDCKLEPDTPMKNKCESCERCYQACPTDTIKPETVHDFKDCLSYLTQARGVQPVKVRKLYGNRLWGCDTCQDVCPYNKDIPRGIHSEFLPHIIPDLEKIMYFTDNNLPQNWRDSALSWRGTRILKRNALTVMANLKKIEYIPLIKQGLTDSSSVVKTYSRWALNMLQTN